MNIMEIDWLTSDDYKNILRNRFNKDDLHILDANIKPLSDNEEGFMGDHYKLLITYEDEEIKKQENFFIKTKAKTYVSQRQIMLDVNCYEKEIFLYDFLFKEFAKYGFDTSFAATSYYCIAGETLILENMTFKNFKVPERQTIYDLVHVKCLLKSLALLHGAAFAYEQKKSKELGRPYSIDHEYGKSISETLFTMYTGGPRFGVQWFNSSLRSFPTLIDQLPKDTEYKESFKKMLQTDEIGKAFVDKTGVTKIFGHGDLWSNNMLFRFDNNVAQECCLVDYQLARYFYPGFDVICAIYFNTNAKFRSEHLEDLYQYYYDTLGEILSNYGYKVEKLLPLEDFHKGMALCKLEAFVQVASVNGMVFVPADILNKASSDHLKDEPDVEESFYKPKQYIATVAYKTDEIFRNIISENLYDLYDALCERLNVD